MRPEGLTLVHDSCPKRCAIAIQLGTSHLQKAKQECSRVVQKKGKEEEERSSGAGPPV
jgi:hypothetical protein